MNVFTDPILLKSIERILLVLASAYLGYLGYKLFLYGIASGRGAPNVRSQVPAALWSGVAPGLFFMLVAGLVVIVVSLSAGPQPQTARARPTPASSITRTSERADLVRQIDLLRQAEKIHQDVIRSLRSQLVFAKTNNAMTQAVVQQMQESLNTASPNVDFNAIYTQMTEMSDALDELQTENDTLRAENAALRTQGTQNSQQ